MRLIEPSSLTVRLRPLATCCQRRFLPIPGAGVVEGIAELAPCGEGTEILDHGRGPSTKVWRRAVGTPAPARAVFIAGLQHEVPA